MALRNLFYLLHRLDSLLIRTLTIFATLAGIGLAVSVLLGVLARFVFKAPLGWGEEVPKYCMVWMTFIGAPIVMHHGGHIVVDGWHALLPPRPRHLVKMAISLVCCCFLAFFVYYGWKAALAASGQRIIMLSNLSMFWVYLSVPLGSAVFFFSNLLQACSHLYQALTLAPDPFSRSTQ